LYHFYFPFIASLIIIVDSFLEQVSNLSTSATLNTEDDDSSHHTRQKPVDLSFEAVQLKLRQKKRKSSSETLLLDGSIHGRAQPGRMLAIMGPSGAGKSTLLHALAGNIAENINMELQGRRYLNGQLITGDSMLPAALIEQEVNFFSHMTVQETLEFRVQLKLGSVLTRRAQDAMVQDLLDQLGLTKARHTIVGDAKTRGISGGERKRLSIAVEMINSPSIIFLDEPTSGLDSTAATSLVENLRDLANAGKTIVAVIHQPSQHVFSQFDDLLLLSEGKQMYYGPIDQVRSYMTNLGYKPQPETGTAEHVIDCVSRSCMPGEHDMDMAIQRVDHIGKQAAMQKVDLNIDPEYNHHKGAKRYTGQSIRKRANVLIQFKLLLGRALAETFRGKVALIIKLVQQVSIGLIYGGIYRLGTNQVSVKTHPSCSRRWFATLYSCSHYFVFLLSLLH
jgi:ABC-type multidrug transport system ATPase subunit